MKLEEPDRGVSRGVSKGKESDRRLTNFKNKNKAADIMIKMVISLLYVL